MTDDERDDLDLATRRARRPVPTDDVITTHLHENPHLLPRFCPHCRAAFHSGHFVRLPLLTLDPTHPSGYRKAPGMIPAVARTCPSCHAITLYNARALRLV